MSRIFNIGSVLLLVLGVSLANTQKAKDPPPPPPPKAAKPPAKAPNPKGGTPNAIPPGAARIVNPANPLTRLYRATPEQREAAIEKLNPKQQENARKQLEWFDKLPKDQQQRWLRRFDLYEQYSPEKKAEIQALVRASQQLPQGRPAAIGRTLYRLQQLSDDQRERILHSQPFKEQFSPEEYRIISGLADVWLGPQQP